MVTTRSKTGSLPVVAKHDPPANLNVVSKTTRRVQNARPSVRQDSKLLQLPVEILQEILSAADLIDLLNWSLCCRDFNDWLTSKRSGKIWQDAIDNTSLFNRTYDHYYRSFFYGSRYRKPTGTTPVQMPPRPPSMPHFLYSRLLFSHGCVTCGRDISVRCVFTCSGLEKMCERCKKSTLVSRNHLKDIWAREDLPKAFWTAIPVGIAKYWGDGLPSPNKLAYDLDASEAFLADYQKFEAQYGFDAAALDTFIDVAREKQRGLQGFLRAFWRWPETRKDALLVRDEAIAKYWHKMRPLVDISNRKSIIKRAIAERPQLEESDVTAAMVSLYTLSKFDRPISETMWADIRSAILKESEKVLAAREEFTSIFNPECIAFRDALRPYWIESIATFRQKSQEPDNIVTPTLHEFSMLPALAPLRGHSPPSHTKVKLYADKIREGFDAIQGDIYTELEIYSNNNLMQLVAKLGGKRPKASDVLSRLSHPTAIFICDSCQTTFKGLQALYSFHKCTATKNLPSLNYSAIGTYYQSQAFKTAYTNELAIGVWANDSKLSRIPVRTLSKIRVDKEQSADVTRILSLLPSYDIEISEPITMEKLESVTADLTFVCEVCKRCDRREGAGHYRGVRVLLAHFKRARSYPYEYSHMRGEDNKVLTHARFSIHGKSSNKRNAGKVVKYTELDVE